MKTKWITECQPRKNKYKNHFRKFRASGQWEQKSLEEYEVFLLPQIGPGQGWGCPRSQLSLGLFQDRERAVWGYPQSHMISVHLGNKQPLHTLLTLKSEISSTVFHSGDCHEVRQNGKHVALTASNLGITLAAPSEIHFPCAAYQPEAESW